MVAVIILLLGLSSRDEGGPYFPLLSFEPPTKMDRFVDWLLKVSIGVAVVTIVLALLWVLFLMGIAIYTLFT